MNNPNLGMLIHRLFHTVNVLGPGKARLGIWVQGCSIHCPGCMTPESWEFNPQYFCPFSIIERELIQSKKTGTNSAVISGGEPFDQPDNLFILLKLLKKHNYNDILLYTGYNYNKIITKFPNHLRFIDLLITEPFIITETNLKMWRGSDNQKIHVIKSKTNYDEILLNELTYPSNRELQIVKENNNIFIVGIPKRGDIKKIHELQF